MSDMIKKTVLQPPPVIKTVLQKTEARQTVLKVGQGPAGKSAEDFVSDPVAYYILAKS